MTGVKDPSRQTRLWQIAVLLGIAVLAWLPGLLSLPALDRDESRFAQATRQMIDSGDYVDIRLGDAPRYNKPIGIYWLQSAAVKAASLVAASARNAIPFYRIPSFLCGLASIFLTFWIARALAPPRTAFLAAVVFGVTLLLAVESVIATTDAALLACTLAAQGVLLRAWLARVERHALPFGFALLGWAAIGAGILIKGPVIVGVVGVTAIAISIWQRDWDWLRTTRPLSGVALAAAIVAPWAIAIGLASHGVFFQHSLGHDFAAKLAGGQESHGAPPGYYLALLSFTFWPATLFLLPAVGLAVRRRFDPGVRFLVAWAGACWLMFEIVPTKLPHYILPVYPALAILAAMWIEEAVDEKRWQRIFRFVACAQFLLGVAVLAALPIVVPRRFGVSIHSGLLAMTGMAAIAGIVAVAFMIRREKIPALAAAALSAVMFYPIVEAGIAPQLQPLWISDGIAGLVAHGSRPHDPPVLSAGYAEPSLLFRLGGDMQILTGEGAANLAASRGGLAVVEDHESAAFLSRLGELRAVVVPVGRVSGFDYSRGIKERITVYRVNQTPRQP